MKAHEVLLTDDEWNAVYDVYPRDVPVIDPRLLDFSQGAKDPQYLIEGTSVYREYAQQCRCWMCNYMLARASYNRFSSLYRFAEQDLCGRRAKVPS